MNKKIKQQYMALSNTLILKFMTESTGGYNSRAEEINYRQLAHLCTSSLSDIIERNKNNPQEAYRNICSLLNRIDDIITSDSPDSLKYSLNILKLNANGLWF